MISLTWRHFFWSITLTNYSLDQFFKKESTELSVRVLFLVYHHSNVPCCWKNTHVIYLFKILKLTLKGWLGRLRGLILGWIWHFECRNEIGTSGSKHANLVLKAKIFIWEYFEISKMPMIKFVLWNLVLKHSVWIIASYTKS